MARSDYAHHNEDADMIWWQEEGRFEGTQEPELCDGGCGYGRHLGDCYEEPDWDGEEDDEDGEDQ